MLGLRLNHFSKMGSWNELFIFNHASYDSIDLFPVGPYHVPLLRDNTGNNGAVFTESIMGSLPNCRPEQCDCGSQDGWCQPANIYGISSPILCAAYQHQHGHNLIKTGYHYSIYISKILRFACVSFRHTRTFQNCWYVYRILFHFSLHWLYIF